MSTTSTIAKVNADGSIAAIYCHWDGDLSHVGKILLNHYNNEDAINNLLELGNLSCLGPVVGEKINFDTQAPNQCVAYGRDRGEKNQSAKKFSNHSSYEKYATQNYNYLYENGSWIVKTYKGTKNLSDVVV